MIKKQQKTILLLALAVFVLLTAYLFLLRPMLADKNGNNEKQKYDKDGDLLSDGGQPFLYPTIEKEKVSTIKVTNSHGSYTVYRDKATGEFVVKGAESLLYDAKLLSSLYVQACYMLSIQKIENPSKELSKYGLSESDSPAAVEVETTDGTHHKVYIGNKLITGGAYYAKESEKPYVYALSTELENTLLADVRSFFTPLLTSPISQEECAKIDDFRLYKNRQLFVECKLIPDNEKNGAINTHQMIFPAEYIPSTSNFLKVLESFIQFTGSRVSEYAVSKQPNYSDLLKKYGMDAPAYEIKYNYKGKEHYIIIGGKPEGEKAYYAYSPEMDLIAVLPEETVPFVQWNLLDFIEPSIFKRNINDIASLILETPDLHHEYTLTGTGDTLAVTENGKSVDTKNFRQFFILLLSPTIQDKAESTNDKLPLLLTMRAVTDFGETYTYQFYSLSTRRVLFTINGKGEFYVGRDGVDTIINNLKKLAVGETINAGT